MERFSMIYIDHVCIGCQNLYESAARLRKETKLDNYDGGWGSIGNALRVVPLGNHQYLEVESIIDARKAAGSAMAQYFSDRTVTGDALIGWVLRVDTLDELTEIAARIGRTKNVGPFTARHMPDGAAVQVYATPPSIETWPKGIPNFVYWPETTMHPGNGAARHWVQPHGIAWIELGGNEKEILEWIGPGGNDLPLRFTGGDPGLRAVAVNTSLGEKVVRR
jgi:hypothetical protein